MAEFRSNLMRHGQDNVYVQICKSYNTDRDMIMKTTWTTLHWVTHNTCHLQLFQPDHRGHNCSYDRSGLGQSDVTTGHRLPARKYPACLVAGILWPRERDHVLPVRLLGRMSRGERLLVTGNWKGNIEYVPLFYNCACHLLVWTPAVLFS